MFERACGRCGAGLRERDTVCRNCKATVGSAGKVSGDKPRPERRFTGDARGVRLPEPSAPLGKSPELLLHESLERAEAEPSFAEAALNVPASPRPEKPKTPRRPRTRTTPAPAPAPLLIDTAAEAATEPATEPLSPVEPEPAPLAETPAAVEAEEAVA